MACAAKRACGVTKQRCSNTRGALCTRASGRKSTPLDGEEMAHGGLLAISTKIRLQDLSFEAREATHQLRGLVCEALLLSTLCSCRHLCGGEAATFPPGRSKRVDSYVCSRRRSRWFTEARARPHGYFQRFSGAFAATGWQQWNVLELLSATFGGVFWAFDARRSGLIVEVGADAANLSCRVGTRGTLLYKTL
jgi:hypothetical protein